MFSNIPNHVQQALKRLLTQYQNAPVLQGFLTAIINPIQTIEDELGVMNTARYLPAAVGNQLDIIGSIVGIKRPAGMPDDQYLLEIYGQIKINVSEGQPEQIIQAYELFTSVPFVILTEFHNASLIVASTYAPPDQKTVDRLILTIKKAAPAGVRVDGLITFDADMAFAYDGDLPGFGYDDGTQTVGGKYADLHQFIGGGFAYDGDDSSGLGYGTQDDPLAGGAYLT